MESGYPDETLNRYIRDELPAAERQAIWQSIQGSPELRARIEALEEAYHLEAFSMAISPPASAKADFMAAIADEASGPRLEDFRIQQGSTRAQFQTYLDKKEMQRPADFKNFHSKFMFKVKNLESHLVWLKKGVPEEVHSDLLEYFLCLEGTAEVRMGSEVRVVRPGDIFHIPLYVPHSVRVTSTIPCAFICQREYLG